MKTEVKQSLQEKYFAVREKYFAVREKYFLLRAVVSLFVY